MVTDPGLLQVIGCAHQGEPDTAVSWHLVRLITTVLYGLEGRESKEGSELDLCEPQRERKGQALDNRHKPSQLLQGAQMEYTQAVQQSQTGEPHPT